MTQSHLLNTVTDGRSQSPLEGRNIPPFPTTIPQTWQSLNSPSEEIWSVPAELWAPAAELLLWFGDWLTCTAGALVRFSLVLVQLDLVKLIPAFRLPGWARTPACYCLVYDRVGGWVASIMGVGCWASLKPLLVEGRQQKNIPLSPLAVENMEMYAFIFYILFSWLQPWMLACRRHKDTVGGSVQTMDCSGDYLFYSKTVGFLFVSQKRTCPRWGKLRWGIRFSLCLNL